MDLLWLLLTLPYAPVRGLTAVAKVVQRQAEAQLSDPAYIRRELEVADQRLASGEIPPDEHVRIQEQVLDRLVAPTVLDRAPAAAGPQGREVTTNGSTGRTIRRG